jgi:hypothetical protein
MTEQDLIDLGFVKHMDHGIECSDDLGSEWIEDAYHYYAYDLVNGLDFISCASDEANSGEWFVELFDTWPAIRFTDKEEVGNLISLLKSRIVPDVSTIDTDLLVNSAFEDEDIDSQIDQE